jgi:hypothetical protein
LIELRFKPSNEGGRSADVSGDVYGIPLVVGGEAFDCRLLLDGKTLKLGETYTVPAAFLRPELVLPQLSPNQKVSLWEGREIGTGRVITLLE